MESLRLLLLWDRGMYHTTHRIYSRHESHGTSAIAKRHGKQAIQKQMSQLLVPGDPSTNQCTSNSSFGLFNSLKSHSRKQLCHTGSSPYPPPRQTSVRTPSPATLLTWTISDGSRLELVAPAISLSLRGPWVGDQDTNWPSVHLCFRKCLVGAHSVG